MFMLPPVYVTLQFFLELCTVNICDHYASFLKRRRIKTKASSVYNFKTDTQHIYN